MNRRPLIASTCGETEVRQPPGQGFTWIEKNQKWEYWISHNVAKKFQSAFGCVTCLPGCFSMHRVDDFVGNNYVMQEFDKHPSKGSIKESNLLELGEDRYLTLLLLFWQCFPQTPSRKQICYTPRAKCTTTAPRTWEKYRNQRRRWNNSTYMCILDFMPTVLTSKEMPPVMKYQSFIDFLGVYLCLSMNVHFALIFLNILTNTSESVLPSMTSFTEVAVTFIWIIAQAVIAIRHGKAGYLSYMAINLLSNPFITMFLSFFCYQRLDDFNWGTR